MEGYRERTTAKKRSTTRSDAPFAGLAKGLTGSLILAGDDDYELARRVFNAAIDRRPAAIVRAAATADVARAVDFARTHDLPVAYEMCTRALILSNGRVAADGPVGEILADADLLDANDLELPKGFLIDAGHT